MPARSQWTEEEARDWYERQPWPVGCNYIPSNAINQLEMWQAETFDEATNDRELGWAAGLGFNTVRVYLHDLLWEDPQGFLDRIDRFLDIASRHGIHTLFVLLDGIWDPHPRAGPQRAPRPRVHNSRWLQSPGVEIFADPLRHDELRHYVTGVVGHFRDDERILGWDIFNEPDNPNHAYATDEPANKRALALALIRKAYNWAREAGPSQPITSGVWRPEWVSTGARSELDEFQLRASDIISFHAYTGPARLQERVDDLVALGRPLFLTEYLARPYGSTFEAVLPILRERKVAAYCWGLVSGKTQTIYPWDSWAKTYDSEPDPWFHDILRPDGTPYRDEEAAFLRDMTVGA